MANRGLEATTIYNGFETNPPTGDRERTRAELDLSAGQLLCAHPVRAIARKNIPGAIAITEALGGVYWLLGQPEEDYGDTLADVLGAAKCRVEHASAPSRSDIYAAADVVLFPSFWEGFGNPPIEAAIYRRPAVVGSYPVAAELAELGFEWFSPHELDPLRRWLAEPDPSILEHNRAIAIEHFSLEAMTRDIESLLDSRGWLP
jgi:glycosyltransferase involved in cell wall biosynthesis